MTPEDWPRVRIVRRRTVAAVAVSAVAVVGLFVASVAGADPPPSVLVPAEVNLFASATMPGHPTTSDSAATELGVRFTADTSGEVTGLRFYKGTGNTGAHVGHLWSSGGALLATVSFVGETASGWQTAFFPQRIAVTSGATYTVSYLAPKGHYAADATFTAPVDNAPLHAPVNAGVYRYGSSGGVPTQTYQASNYWVDPVFKPTAAAATTTTSTTTTAPATTTTAVPETTTTTPPAADGRGVSPANTGWAPTGVTLTPYTGPRVIDVAGTVIDSADITLCPLVRAANVTIRRSRISCTGDFGILHDDGPGLLVEDVEITSATTTGAGEQASVDRAIGAYGGISTYRRVYVHGTRRGMIFGDDVTVESSYVGDNVNNTDGHTTAVATIGGSDRVTIRGSNLSTAPNTTASSAGSFYPQTDSGGANHDFIIEGNLFDTGGGFGLYVGYTPSDGESPNRNFRINNNWFGVRYNANCGEGGPVSNANNGLQAGGGTWAENRWYAPGQAKDGSLVELP